MPELGLRGTHTGYAPGCERLRALACAGDVGGAPIGQGGHASAIGVDPPPLWVGVVPPPVLRNQGAVLERRHRTGRLRHPTGDARPDVRRRLRPLRMASPRTRPLLLVCSLLLGLR